MKSALILAIVALACISSVQCTDMIVGTSFKNKLLWQQKVEYNAIPLKKRVKEVFYSDPAQQILKGVIARDLDHSGAEVSITAGGVGFSFVNLRLKSERGSGLNYNVELYV